MSGGPNASLGGGGGMGGGGGWMSMFGGSGGQGGQGGGWMDMMKSFGGQMQKQGQGGLAQSQENKDLVDKAGFAKPATSGMGGGSDMTTYDKGTRWVGTGDYQFYVPRKNMDAIDASREGFRKNYKFTSWMGK